MKTHNTIIDQLNTPRKFLIWMQQLDKRPDRLLRLCGEATGDLTRIEAHTCLVMWELLGKGETKAPTGRLTRVAGREVQTSCMRSLEVKGYVRNVPAPETAYVDPYKAIWWELTPAAGLLVPVMLEKLERLVVQVVSAFRHSAVSGYAERLAAKREPELEEVKA